VALEATSTRFRTTVGRRSLLVGGAAALLAGAGLMKPAPALAAGSTGGASETMGTDPFGLSPAQQVGQLVIWSYPGLTPPQALFDAIRAGLVGGVIFFGENINRSDRSQIQAVTSELAQAQADSGIGYPLLLMTDQKGGIVQRLPGAPGISEKQIGASADPVGAAQSAGTGAAQNLLDAGMNCNPRRYSTSTGKPATSTTSSDARTAWIRLSAVSAVPRP
jgi:beta-N-acetylhexosaminidase